MIITHSQPEDINEIFRLYDLARQNQQARLDVVVWPVFDRDMVAAEIAAQRQFKLVKDGQIACVWAVTFDDPQIWEEKNADPSVYIHRIATNPAFKGNHLVVEIVKWAKTFAQMNHKQFIRLDTVGENKSLIAHYERCGFTFLGLLTLKQTDGLPAHYQNATVSLFEIQITA